MHYIEAPGGNGGRSSAFAISDGFIGSSIFCSMIVVTTYRNTFPIVWIMRWLTDSAFLKTLVEGPTTYKICTPTEGGGGGGWQGGNVSDVKERESTGGKSHNTGKNQRNWREVLFDVLLLLFVCLCVCYMILYGLRRITQHTGHSCMPWSWSSAR